METTQKQFFFIAVSTQSFSIRAPSGQMYHFMGGKPKLAESRDLQFLEKQSKLSRCDKDGNLLGRQPTAKPKPLSVVKFKPSTAERPEQPQVRRRIV